MIFHKSIMYDISPLPFFVCGVEFDKLYLMYYWVDY